jgi:hypothetical protein
MPKSDLPFSDDYSPVAERIRLFYESHPRGSILTHLVSQRDGEITFVAYAYRDSCDRRPGATGWASERIGDGDVNAVACLENTETSAIGRALANLGFTASRHRPSAEEMQKAARARARLRSAGRYPEPSAAALVREASGVPIDADPLQHAANEITETLGMITTAVSYGMRPARAERLRERLRAGDISAEGMARIRQLLRALIAKERQRARRDDERLKG